MVALLGLEDQRRIPIRERETVWFSLRTLWRIFVVFCHDTVVDFWLNIKDSRVLGKGLCCGGFLHQHKGFTCFGKGLRGCLSVVYLFSEYRAFGEEWRGRGWSFIRRNGSKSLPPGGVLPWRRPFSLSILAGK